MSSNRSQVLVYYYNDEDGKYQNNPWKLETHGEVLEVWEWKEVSLKKKIDLTKNQKLTSFFPLVNGMTMQKNSTMDQPVEFVCTYQRSGMFVVLCPFCKNHTKQQQHLYNYGACNCYYTKKGSFLSLEEIKAKCEKDKEWEYYHIYKLPPIQMQRLDKEKDQESLIQILKTKSII